MSTRLFIAWLCNLIDTAATLHLSANYAGTELNPISAALLPYPPLFVAYKLVMMTILVALLWWKREWKLCKAVSWVVCINYLAVSIYYLFVYLILLPAYA